jgi:hypothetical protein
MSTGIAAALSCTTSPSTSGALTCMKRDLTLSSVIPGAREPLPTARKPQTGLISSTHTNAVFIDTSRKKHEE